eukprot:240376-Hanusia_phi.AAC.1
MPKGYPSAPRLSSFLEPYPPYSDTPLPPHPCPSTSLLHTASGIGFLVPRASQLSPRTLLAAPCSLPSLLSVLSLTLWLPPRASSSPL